MPKPTPVQGVTNYSAAYTRACEKGQQWERAMGLLQELLRSRVEPDTISYTASIGACEKGFRWERALSLVGCMCCS